VPSCKHWGSPHETFGAGICTSRGRLFIVRPVKARSPDSGDGPASPLDFHHWKNAVQIQDSLYYGPPEWFYPVRESLGAALMLNGQPAQAESVFRADLEQYPRNPRSLFGLLKSLEAQNKSSDAEWVRREFEAAWTNADVTLELGDL
jgi:hypothetical protein